MRSPDLTEARLWNWARWAREHGFLGTELSAVWSMDDQRYAPADRGEAYGVLDSSPTPDEIDAAEVERVMLALKQDNRSAYWALWERYHNRRDDMTAADAHRWTMTRYHGLIRQGMGYVRKRLTSRD